MRRYLRICGLVLLLVMLAACSSAPAPAGDSGQLPELVGSLVRSGGIAGETVFVRVYADGTLIFGNESGSTLTTAQATPEEVAGLQAAFASEAWRSLDGRYGRQTPDAYSYTVSGGGKTVETFDGSSNPAILAQVLDQLSRLMAASPSR